jgi:hypothetical protein
MFRVKWLQEALNDLTLIWMQADSAAPRFRLAESGLKIQL